MALEGGNYSRGALFQGGRSFENQRIEKALIGSLKYK